MSLALKARIVAHFGAQHCSSLCSQSEGREDESAATAEFVALFAIGSSPSLCKQSELQCFAPVSYNAGAEKRDYVTPQRQYSSLA